MKNVIVLSKNYMTRALSITLILGLLLSSLTFSSSSGFSEIFNTNVWADINGYWTDDNAGTNDEPNYSTTWYTENKDTRGTADKPFLIASAKELAGLAKLVNDGTDTFEGKYIKLTDDIDLGAHYWVPIGLGNTKDDNGDPVNIFKGSFNGNNTTISNMRIGTDDNPANYIYAGLFGYVRADRDQSVTIENVNIKESSIYSNIYNKNCKAGGICGFVSTDDYADMITISNCSNSGLVSGKNYVGGICGSVSTNTYAHVTISNCSNSGQISGNYNVGGICGSAYTNGTKASTMISNCSNSGLVSGNHYAGGICSSAYASYDCDYVTISNCSNSGLVSGKYVAGGGICGYTDTEGTLTISNCYYLDGSVGEVSESGEFVPNEQQNGIGNQNDQTGTTALPESQMKAAAGTTDASWTSITVKDIYGNILDDYIEGNKVVALVDALNAWVENENENDENEYGYKYWELETADGSGKGYPVPKSEEPVTGPVEIDEATNETANENTWSEISEGIYKYADFSPFTTANKGDSKENAYEINNAAQLAALAILVNNYDSNNPGKTVSDGKGNIATCSNFVEKYIKLTDNIDLEAHYWVPIGIDINRSFSGSFDGNNKTISNMHIGIKDEGNNYDNIGLFGYVLADKGKTVTIENVNIKESSIYSENSSVGGICGVANSTAGTIKISNCSNSASITGKINNSAGGICGVALEALIINCSNSGQISRNNSTGGICGVASEATIINCSNSGQISGNSSVGGICGGLLADDLNSTSTLIINCSNSGQVSGTDMVEGIHTDRIGGICGRLTVADDEAGRIAISNCYYLDGSVGEVSESGEFVPNKQQNGIGNQDDQTGTTIALPESQMKAAEDAYNLDNTWVEINGMEKIALVDALNNWVATNQNNNDLLGWTQNGSVNNGYPISSVNN